MPHHGDFQLEIYLDGLAGKYPAFPVSAEALETAARQVMSPEAYSYVAGSAGAEATARANRQAFDRYEIVPRMLRGIAQRDLTSEVCGTELAAPVMLAPIGAAGMIHPDGELGAARAAADVGVPMVLSTVSNTTLEEVAAALAKPAGQAGRPGTGWFQLYWPRDQQVAASLVGRAAAAGYRAIVVTVDTWALAWRPRDLGHAFLPFLRGLGVANYFSDPAFRAGLARPPEEDQAAAVIHWAQMFGNPTLTWSDLAWLRERTSLPILVKGICHPDDARAARDAGVDGIVVSNHGGRQIDGARPALDCLPDVVAACPALPVLFDSGIRSGSDILKAVALGARAVLVGRPWVYGLALGGAEGVRHVLRCLLAELDLTMALSGHATLSSVGPDLFG
ncbi:MAG: alpha-hydroxy-acid oxidizing protein [Actinomycetota bacterium]|nr:alpha-hydroxy-acid oxidizing protein [Actinomycetota bacterium]